MATEQITSLLLINLLKENREKLNSLFSFYRFTYPVIEEEVIFFYFSYIIEPIIDSNSKRSKSILSVFLLALYEKILELIGKNFLGNSGRYPFFEKYFIRSLKDSNELMFENPEVYISSICNAIINVGKVDVISLESWLQKLSKLNKKAHSIQELFDAGIVASWVCGMAQYRFKSLQIMRKLDIELLQIIFDISNIRNINRDSFFNRLENDPWINPESALKENSPKTIFLLKRVGSFSGFGGQFITPPQVELLNNEFVISDSKNFFILFSDVFGSYLMRISEDTYLSLLSENQTKNNSDFSIDKEGTIRKHKDALNYPFLKNNNSYASNETTLCISSPYFHSICVVGLG